MRPLVPGADRGRPTSPEGRRPRTPPRDGTCRGTPGASPPGASGGGLLDLGGGQGPSPKHREDATPVTSRPESPGQRTPPPKGGQLALPPAWDPQAATALAPPRPARSPPVGRAGGARASPTALFLIRAEIALGPSPPARPPRPRGRLPNASRPAQPAAPSEARFRLFSHSRHPPLLPSCVRPSPPRPANSTRASARPSARRAPSARAHRGDPGGSRAGRAASQSGRIEWSAERST